MTFLSILNYIGDIASAADGILMAQKVTKNRLIWLIAAVLAAFGGGFFIRDLMLLRTTPSILGAPHEITVTVAFALTMSLVICHTKEIAKNASNFAARMPAMLKVVFLAIDSLGILASTAIGYERGLQMDGSLLMTVLCGWVTAVGGGILARTVSSIIASKPFTRKFQWLTHELNRNIPYYAYSLVTALTYGLGAMTVGKDLALIILTIPIVLIRILIDKEVMIGA